MEWTRPTNFQRDSRLARLYPPITPVSLKTHCPPSSCRLAKQDTLWPPRTRIPSFPRVSNPPATCKPSRRLNALPCSPPGRRNSVALRNSSRSRRPRSRPRHSHRPRRPTNQAARPQLGSRDPPPHNSHRPWRPHTTQTSTHTQSNHNPTTGDKLGLASHRGPRDRRGTAALPPS